MGDVISKAESYSTANQHLLVKKLLLVILMITIIVDMVSCFLFFYNAYMNCSLGEKGLSAENQFISFIHVVVKADPAPPVITSGSHRGAL